MKLSDKIRRVQGGMALILHVHKLTIPYKLAPSSGSLRSGSQSRLQGTLRGSKGSPANKQIPYKIIMKKAI